MKRYIEFRFRSTSFFVFIFLSLLFLFEACNNEDVYCDISLDLFFGIQGASVQLGEIGPLPDKGYCYLKLKSEDLYNSKAEIIESEFVADKNMDCLEFVVDIAFGDEAAHIPFKVFEKLKNSGCYKFYVETDALNTTEPTEARVSECIYCNIVLELEDRDDNIAMIDLGEFGPLPEAGVCMLMFETDNFWGPNTRLIESLAVGGEEMEDLIFTMHEYSADRPRPAIPPFISFRVSQNLKHGASYKFFINKNAIYEEITDAEVTKL